MYLYSIILCENTIVDSQSNKLSIINCVETIFTTILPNVYPALQIVTQWFHEQSKEPLEDLLFRIKIGNPSGSINEKTFEHKIELDKGNDRHRVIVNLQGIPLTEVGIMKIIIDVKSGEEWKEIGYLPLTIKKVEKI